ncbi:hornerin-like [Sarcophilus harrisii]|uniref:hornerin-like n=1 Tax=Sarcophilus harrisii TaxID=9305 RepID=UPI001301C6AC|nr:hornerin-like [Sarcophilus harrisii]
MKHMSSSMKKGGTQPSTASQHQSRPSPVEKDPNDNHQLHTRAKQSSDFWRSHPEPGGLVIVQSQGRRSDPPQARDGRRAVAQHEAKAERAQGGGEGCQEEPPRPADAAETAAGERRPRPGSPRARLLGFGPWAQQRLSGLGIHGVSAAAPSRSHNTGELRPRRLLGHCSGGPRPGSPAPRRGGGTSPAGWQGGGARAPAGPSRRGAGSCTGGGVAPRLLSVGPGKGRGHHGGGARAHLMGSGRAEVRPLGSCLPGGGGGPADGPGMTAWEARTESDSNTEGQSNPTLYLGSGAGAGRGETREPSRPRPTELSGHTRSHGTDGLGTKNNAHKVDLRHLVVRPLIDRQHRGKLSHSPSAQAWCPPSKGSPSRRETQLVAPALLPRSTRHLLEEASAGKDRTSRTNPSISLVKQQIRT